MTSYYGPAYGSGSGGLPLSLRLAARAVVANGLRGLEALLALRRACASTVATDLPATIADAVKAADASLTPQQGVTTVGGSGNAVSSIPGSGGGSGSAGSGSGSGGNPAWNAYSAANPAATDIDPRRVQAYPGEYPIVADLLLDANVSDRLAQIVKFHKAQTVASDSARAADAGYSDALRGTDAWQTLRMGLRIYYSITRLNFDVDRIEQVAYLVKDGLVLEAHDGSGSGSGSGDPYLDAKGYARFARLARHLKVGDFDGSQFDFGYGPGQGDGTDPGSGDPDHLVPGEVGDPGQWWVPGGMGVWQPLLNAIEAKELSLLSPAEGAMGRSPPVEWHQPYNDIPWPRVAGTSNSVLVPADEGEKGYPKFGGTSAGSGVYGVSTNIGSGGAYDPAAPMPNLYPYLHNIVTPAGGV